MLKYLNFGGFLLSEKRNSIFAGNLKNCVGVENELNVITVRYNIIFVLFSKRKSWKNPVFMGVMRALQKGQRIEFNEIIT